jgi:hypothetical protein
MDAVADIRSDARRLAGILNTQRLDRRHARLAPLLKILTLLVAGSGGAPEAGIDTPGPTLLFEMSALSEALLAARLRAVAAGCVVRVQILASHSTPIGAFRSGRTWWSRYRVRRCLSSTPSGSGLREG